MKQHKWISKTQSEAKEGRPPPPPCKKKNPYWMIPLAQNSEMIKFLYIDRKQINGQPGTESMGEDGEVTEEMLQGTLEMKKNVLYLDWTSGYIDAYIYQNSLNHTLEMDAFIQQTSTIT